MAKNNKKQFLTDTRFYNVYANFRLETLAKKIKEEQQLKYNLKSLSIHNSRV